MKFKMPNKLKRIKFEKNKRLNKMPKKPTGIQQFNPGKHGREQAARDLSRTKNSDAG